MFKLEKRPFDSKAMSYYSPLIALGLTLFFGGLLFTSLGHNPFTALYTFFILPLSDAYGLTELGMKVALGFVLFRGQE